MHIHTSFITTIRDKIKYVNHLSYGQSPFQTPTPHSENTELGFNLPDTNFPVGSLQLKKKKKIKKSIPS